MIYPEKYVHEYGAKAGLLMYIKEHLPYIPQMPMVVKRPTDNIDDILSQADDENIGWPRLFRSSTLEELYGFEGFFPTTKADKNELRFVRGEEITRFCKNLDEFNHYAKKEIMVIQNFLSKNMPVIITEQHQGELNGVLVEHPNQKGVLYMRTSYYAGGYNNRHHAVFQYADGKVQPMESFSVVMNRDYENWMPTLIAQLQNVASWYNEIKALPEIDKEYSWQIEFGIDPAKKMEMPECIFQFKPFRKKQFAEYTIPKSRGAEELIVFGITPEYGIEIKVKKDIRKKYLERKLPNAQRENIGYSGKVQNTGDINILPTLIGIKAALFGFGWGLFAHKDMVIARSVPVVAYSGSSLLDNYEDDEKLRIISDGRTIKINRI